ncbi:echinoderm microtubule-associated protein-like CG42247, partial [Caerostris extrusa]
GHSSRTILFLGICREKPRIAVGDSSGYVTLGPYFRVMLSNSQRNTSSRREVRCLYPLRRNSYFRRTKPTEKFGMLIKDFNIWQLQNPVEVRASYKTRVQFMLVTRTTIATLRGWGDLCRFGKGCNSIRSANWILSLEFFKGIEAGIYDLAVDVKGQSFVTVDKLRNISRWTTRYLMWKTKPQVDCFCVGFHPEGRAIVAGGANGKLLVLHSDGGLVVATIFVADAALKALAYNTDGSVLAIGCEDGNVYICGSKNHGYLYKMHTVLKNEWPILQIDWSTDGDCLQSCYRKADFCEVALWRVAESKRVTSALSQNMNWPEHTCTLSHNILVATEMEKKLATGAQDGHIRIFPYPYREDDQDEYDEQKQSHRAVNVVRFLNGNTLTSSSGSGIYVWNCKK